MSFAGLIMDGLLMVLLVCAIAFAVRLDKKLKALRQGQQDFAKSVADLDAASRRAEAGLAAMREGADEAHDGLHDRILKARELKTQLEALIARAERMPAAAPALAAPRSESPARADLLADPRREIARQPQPAPMPAERPRPATPRRFDEDLFEPGDHPGVR